MKKLLLILSLLSLSSFAQTFNNNTENFPTTMGYLNAGLNYLDVNKMHYAGAWVTSTPYAIQYVVTFNNSVYTSLQSGNVGHRPDTNPLWWDLLASSSVSSSGGSGNVNSNGPKTPNAIIVYDSLGNIVSSECTVVNSSITCTDPTVSSSLRLTELGTRGNSFKIFGADTQNVSGCMRMPVGDSSIGQTLIDSGTTATMSDGTVCRVMAWGNVTGGTSTPVVVTKTFRPFTTSVFGQYQIQMKIETNSPAYGINGMWTLTSTDTAELSFDEFFPSTYVPGSALVTIYYTGYPGAASTGSVQFKLGSMLTKIGKDGSVDTWTTTLVPMVNSPGYTFGILTTSVNPVFASAPNGTIVTIKTGRNGQLSGNSADSVSVSQIVLQYSHT